MIIFVLMILNFFYFRELLIVFVYDSRFCTTEADDPQNAILYFHPPWVSSSQKLALSGQLMGIAKFSSSAFAIPSILALKSGKFAFRQFGSSTLVNINLKLLRLL